MFLVPHFLSDCLALGIAGGRISVYPRRRCYLERVYSGSNLFTLRRVEDTTPRARSIQHPVLNAVRSACRCRPDSRAANNVGVPLLPTLFRCRHGRSGEIEEVLSLKTNKNRE